MLKDNRIKDAIYKKIILHAINNIVYVNTT